MDDPDPPPWRQQIAALACNLGAVHVLRSHPPVRARDGWYIHQIPSLHLCLSGTGVIRHPDGAIAVRPGDIVLMEPCVEHKNAIRAAGDQILHLGFMARWADVSIHTPNGWRLWTMPFNPLRQLLESAILATSDRQRLRYTRELLGTIASQELREVGPRGTPVMAMLESMWRIAYDRNANSSDIVRKSHLSRAQAYRVFTAHYGVGPARAIEVMRLDMARWFLMRGFRVSDIATWVGFSSPSAFGTRWLSQFGRSPRTFIGRLAPLPTQGYAKTRTNTATNHTARIRP